MNHKSFVILLYIWLHTDNQYKDLAFKKYISSSVLGIENSNEHIISRKFNFSLALFGEITPFKKMLGTTTTCRIIVALSVPVSTKLN